MYLYYSLEPMRVGLITGEIGEGMKMGKSSSEKCILLASVFTPVI